MVSDPLTILSNHKPEARNDTDAIASGLRRLWASIVAGIRQGESIAGLHLQQFWVLLLAKESPVRMSDIARSLETSQANVTGLVDRLERGGYVSRVRSDADRRVVDVAITERGIDTIGALQVDYRARVDKALGNLDADERQQLLALLNKALDGQ